MGPPVRRVETDQTSTDQGGPGSPNPMCCFVPGFGGEQLVVSVPIRLRVFPHPDPSNLNLIHQICKQDTSAVIPKPTITESSLTQENWS